MVVVKMSKAAVNINETRICAFCKYWWDPACKYIMPYMRDTWQYDTSAVCRCIKRSVDMPAHSSCGYFRCKIEF